MSSPPSAFSTWNEALKASTAPKLNPAAKSFHLPSSRPMDPAASTFCPEKVHRAVTTTIKASTLPQDASEDAALQRSGWKHQSKGGVRTAANTPRSPKTRVLRPRDTQASVRPPTPPRARASRRIKRATDKIAKKGDAGPAHLQKHLDQLQENMSGGVPLVRSGISDLLDGLAVRGGA